MARRIRNKSLKNKNNSRYGTTGPGTFSGGSTQFSPASAYQNNGLKAGPLESGGRSPMGSYSSRLPGSAVTNVIGGAAQGGAAGGPAGAAIGAGLGVLGGILGAAEPDRFSGVTQEQIDEAIASLNQGYGRAEDISQADRTGGGVTQSGGGFKSGQEVKGEQLPAAAQAFLESQGLSPEEARAMVADAQSSKGGIAKNLREQGYGGLKGFLKEQGDQYGLKVNKQGKIKGERQVDPGGFTSPTDDIKEAGLGINRDILGGLGQVGTGIGADIQEGLGFRSDIRDVIRRELLNAGPEGLTQQDVADLDAMERAGLSNAQSQFKDALQRTTGNLLSQGFMSSNLASKALERGAYKPLASNLRNLEAQQSARRQSILNARANRKNQRIASLLGSSANLGASDLTQAQRSFINPQSFGGFTDPQAEAALRQQGQFDANLQAQAGRDKAQVQTTPTVQQDDGGGFLGIF